MIGKVIVDASVVLEWLESGEKAQAALRLHHDIVTGTIAAWAPDFLLSEVVNILLRKKHASRKDTETFIDTLLTIGISFDDEPDIGTVRAIIDIADTYKTTTYDAKYIYLAKKLQCKLVSFDQKLLQITQWVTTPSYV
ncbi:type II toxin-antitoxin system VapC family toxin [Candidatus Gottesmanbacteria bacterium]|nr:type II toxin-antitoxin system VapC family toxin [Candidatus Gottesmanbacteria bacterium]